MSNHLSFNRRQFLTNSLAVCSAAGTGLVVAGNLFAERTQLAAQAAETDENHPLTPALHLATDSLRSLDDLNDYQATFIKSELIGKNLVHSRMALKLREEPFSVYLKFLSPHAGREVIYVKGRNNDYLQVHDVGFASLAGTLSLDPKGGMAMDGNRYPVSSIGMRIMLVKLVDTWLAERHLEGLTVNIFPNMRIGNLSCKAVEVSHSQRPPEARFQMTRLYLHGETGWPVRVQAYNFPGRRDKEAPLAEDYMYADINANNGFKEIDFSTKNPSYAF